MNSLIDKMRKLEINQCVNGESSEDLCPKIEFHLEIEEVHTIFLSLMASQTDNSKRTQCRCAVIANVTHHSRSRRRLGGNKRIQRGLDPLPSLPNSPSVDSGKCERFFLPPSTAGNCYNACESLKIAAKIAFEHRLEDPALEELFRSLYDCNGSFAELFNNSWDGKEKNKGEIEYFLDQSTRLKLLFPVRNEMKPMLECPLNRTYSTFRPIEGAIDNERFDDLELMIRYGAVLSYETAFGDQISVPQMALDLVFQCYKPERDQLVNKPKLPAYLGFLRLVLRAVPRVTYPMRQRFRNQSMFACPEAVNKDKRAMFEQLQHNGVVSAEVAGKVPPKLKHLARLAVRKALYRAWYLPRGIYELGLPPALEGYLDLKTD